MSPIEVLCKHALEIDAYLVEWALKVLVSIPDSMSVVCNQPDIVEETTGLWRWIKLNESWQCASLDLHLSVWAIYSSKALTTQRLSSWVYSW